MSTIDVRLTSDGDLPRQGDLVVGADLVVQNVLVATRTFLGEDLTDVRKGLPWERWNQSKATRPLLTEVEDLLAATILAVPGVQSITELQASANSLGTVSVACTIVVADLEDETAEATLNFSADDPIGVAYRIVR